jgi:hypothetical protein
MKTELPGEYARKYVEVTGYIQDILNAKRDRGEAIKTSDAQAVIDEVHKKYPGYPMRLQIVKSRIRRYLEMKYSNANNQSQDVPATSVFGNGEKRKVRNKFEIKRPHKEMVDFILEFVKANQDMDSDAFGTVLRNRFMEHFRTGDKMATNDNFMSALRDAMATYRNQSILESRSRRSERRKELLLKSAKRKLDYIEKYKHHNDVRKSYYRDLFIIKAVLEGKRFPQIAREINVHAPNKRKPYNRAMIFYLFNKIPELQDETQALVDAK